MAASRLRPPVLPGGLDAPERAEARSHTQLACRLARTPARAAGHSQRKGAFAQGFTEGWRGYPIRAEWRLFGLLAPQIPHVSHRRSAHRGAWHGWPCAWGSATPRVLPSWQAIPCPSGALALPLGGERTARRAQGRVAVRLTLPPGVERTETVRSGPSGSASGALGGEWQCVSHCHSTVNVPRGASHTATRW